MKSFSSPQPSRGNAPATHAKSSVSTLPVRRLQIFYRYGAPEEIAKLTRDPALNLAEIKNFADRDLNFDGDGLYLAESPITSQLWGDGLCEVWVDQSYIRDGHFQKYGGVGRDWWVGKLDSLLAAKGFDPQKIPSCLTADAEQRRALFSTGIYFKPFTGVALGRHQLVQLCELSEREALRRFFRKQLDQRIYHWSRDPEGRLMAVEYTGLGDRVGELHPSYCTEQNLRRLRNFENLSFDQKRDFASRRAPYLVSFASDLEELANRNRIFSGLTKARLTVTSWIRGSTF
jgi:hypothetical protein